MSYFPAVPKDNLATRTPETARPTTWFTLAPLGAGTFFSLGTPRIDVKDKPVEIMEVVPRYSANLEYVGAIAIWPRDLSGPGIDVAASYPPRGQSRYHPAVGAPIPVAELSFVPKGYDTPPPLGITLGFRFTSGDIGAVSGVTLVYRAGAETMREYFAHAVIACLKPREDCKMSDDQDYPWAVLREVDLIDRPAAPAS